MSYFQEEAFYFSTIHDACELADQFRDRFFEDIEKHRPDIYEMMKAYLANKEIEEFLSNQAETRWKDDCDYWKESND